MVAAVEVVLFPEYDDDVDDKLVNISSSRSIATVFDTLLSSRLIEVMGTSNALVTNFSSKLAGRPPVAITLALRIISSINFFSFNRYIFSSPASTLSQTRSIRSSNTLRQAGLRKTCEICVVVVVDDDDGDEEIRLSR